MENDGTIPATQVQNVQENIPHEQNIPYVDQMFADPETYGFVKKTLRSESWKDKEEEKTTDDHSAY